MLYRQEFPDPDVQGAACEKHARTVASPWRFRPMSDDELREWAAIIRDDRGHEGFLCDWCSGEVAERAEAIYEVRQPNLLQ